MAKGKKKSRGKKVVKAQPTAPVAAAAVGRGSARSATVVSKTNGVDDRQARSYVRKGNGELKFVGGAAMARINALKKKATRIIRPGEREKKKEYLPPTMPPSERFFAGLLMSEASDFMPKKTNGNSSTTDIWEAMCQRLGLPMPNGHLRACYGTYQFHFAHRAALVVEESRHLIAEGMTQVMKSKHSNSNDFNYRYNTYNHKSGAMILNLSSVDHKKKTGHSVLTFFKENAPFSANELAGLRLGTVVACIHPELYPTIPYSLLGTIMPGNREDMINESSFSIMVFRSISPMVTTSNLKWKVIPITSLLAEQRQFEACTSKVVKSVPFLQALLGTKTPTHTRFEDDGGETQTLGTLAEKTSDAESTTERNKTSNNDEKNGGHGEGGKHEGSGENSHGFVEDYDGDDVIEIIDSKGGNNTDDDDDDDNIDKADESDFISSSQPMDLFCTPVLNGMQEKSARSFLSSEENMITLIQGPPGTGKTTLLASILCRYIAKSLYNGNHRRVMVCAPTNKAVSVLCTRFLDSIKGDILPCSVILIGDDDKLLCDDESRYQNYRRNNSYNNGLTNQAGTSATSKLRSIFLYTWVMAVLDDLGRIRKYLKTPPTQRNKNDTQMVKTTSKSLAERIAIGFSTPPKKLLKDLGSIIERLELDASSSTGKGDDGKQILQLLEGIIEEVNAWRVDTIWQDLLSTAQVIFCTLASAGSSIMKRSVGVVDDLIIDEAASSTEPEMYIPFRYKPARLLAVGDPKQLPATVQSQRAEKYGLAKSLHERLMYDCNSKYTMLNVQYRMKPALSRFPCSHFYKGELEDGPNVMSVDYSTGCSLDLKGNDTYSLVQVSGMEQKTESGSTENLAEAEVVVQLIEQIRMKSMGEPKGAKEEGTEKWNSADRIRVITFYQAQVNLIKSLLPATGPNSSSGVVVATVDSTQGCESDIVIVSFVRSHSSMYVRGQASVGFLTDNRRMNVALTRAKYQMICVGNFDRMLKLKSPLAATVRSLAQDAKDRQCILPCEAMGYASSTNEGTSNNKWVKGDGIHGKRKLHGDKEGQGDGQKLETKKVKA